MPRPRTNLTLEGACRLDLAKLLPTERTTSAGDLSWVRGDKLLLNGRYEIFLGARDGRLEIESSELAERLFTIRLVTTSPHLGGVRWWMVCPITNRRAASLYLFENMQRFCHRTAITPTPTYKSQRQTPLVRTSERLARVTDALGWTAGTRIRPKLSPSETTRMMIQALRLHRRRADIFETRQAKLDVRTNRNDFD